jgi:hypothetical protein
MTPSGMMQGGKVCAELMETQAAAAKARSIRSGPLQVIPLSQRLAVPNIALLLGLAWLVIIAQLLADHWAETALTLADMDDAMRLVQMRGFIDGHGWFNLHEARLGPPDGYDTHWSRLIDAGLAGMLWLFGQFTNPAFAERLMRTVWPMLWLLPTMAGATAIAWRIAGRDAAPIALVLTAVGLPPFQHFIPGRIDHHNVQIAIAVLLVAAVAWSDRRRWAAAAAGVLTGAAMAIGFEGLPYIVLAGAAMALRFVLAPDAGRALARYGAWGAGSVAAAFLVSVGPAQWGRTACDAIAVNSAIAVILATLGLALTGRFLAGAHWQVSCRRRRRHRPCRCCGLRSHRDALPCRSVRHDGPDGAIGVVQSCFGNAAAMGGRLDIAPHGSGGRRLSGGRSRVHGAHCPRSGGAPGFRLPGGCDCPDRLGGSAVHHGACLQLRHMAGDPDGGRGCGVRIRLGAAGHDGGPGPDCTVPGAGGHRGGGAGGGASNDRPTCRGGEFAGRRRLPAQRELRCTGGSADYGPFVLALTPHSVMSAPYHRLVGPIIAANDIFALPPAAARQVVAAAKPDYLAVCDRHRLGGIGAAEREASLWGRLAAGEVPAWLEPVAATRDGPFMVYRVRL